VNRYNIFLISLLVRVEWSDSRSSRFTPGERPPPPTAHVMVIINLKIPRSKLEYNIKIHIREIWCDMDWIHLARDRAQWRDIANTIIKVWVP
jgi:hypothetical protein